MRIDPRCDPMAPENLPKGMKVDTVMQEPTLSHSQQNYSGEILKALASIDGLEIDVVKMEVLEEKLMDPIVTLVMEVRRKGDE